MRLLFLAALLSVVACNRPVPQNPFLDGGVRDAGGACSRDSHCASGLRCIAFICQTPPDAAFIPDAAVPDAFVRDAAMSMPDSAMPPDSAVPPDAAVDEDASVDEDAGEALDASTELDAGNNDDAGEDLDASEGGDV